MNARVFDQIELPDGAGIVLLYDWMAEEVRDGRNLIRNDHQGRELWRAEPPFVDEVGQGDCFTQIAWDGTTLTAHTWSCYRAAVNLDSGLVTILGFTK